MLVHAGIDTKLAVGLRSIGGHGQYRQHLPALVPADFACGLQAVHHRHLHIHQHQVVSSGERHFEGFLTVAGNFDDKAFILQDFAGDLLIEQVVFRQQDAAAGDG